MLQSHRGNPLGNLGTNIIEMRRRTADNGPQTYDGVVCLLFSKPFGDERDFPGSRHLDHLNVRFGSPASEQGVQSTAQKAIADKIIEATHYYGKF